MLIIFTLLALTTATLHVMFFKLESLDFMKERVLKRFGLNHDQGALIKIWAFNQGFYNLFLALGLFYSLFLVHRDQLDLGILLAQFILLTIVGAGLVLLASAQALPALLGFVSSLLI